MRLAAAQVAAAAAIATISFAVVAVPVPVRQADAAAPLQQQTRSLSKLEARMNPEPLDLTEALRKAVMNWPGKAVSSGASASAPPGFDALNDAIKSSHIRPASSQRSDPYHGATYSSMNSGQSSSSTSFSAHGRSSDPAPRSPDYSALTLPSEDDLRLWDEIPVPSSSDNVDHHAPGSPDYAALTLPSNEDIRLWDDIPNPSSSGSVNHHHRFVREHEPLHVLPKASDEHGSEIQSDYRPATSPATERLVGASGGEAPVLQPPRSKRRRSKGLIYKNSKKTPEEILQAAKRAKATNSARKKAVKEAMSKTERSQLYIKNKLVAEQSRLRAKGERLSAEDQKALDLLRRITKESLTRARQKVDAAKLLA